MPDHLNAAIVYQVDHHIEFPTWKAYDLIHGTSIPVVVLLNVSSIESTDNDLRSAK